MLIVRHQFQYLFAKMIDSDEQKDNQSDWTDDEMNSIPYDLFENENIVDTISIHEQKFEHQSDDQMKLLHVLDIFTHKWKHEIKVKNLDKLMLRAFDTISEKSILCIDNDEIDDLFLKLWREHLKDHMVKYNLMSHNIDNLHTISQSQDDYQTFRFAVEQVKKYMKKCKYRILLDEKQNNKFSISPDMSVDEMKQIHDKMKEFDALNVELRGDTEINENHDDDKKLFETFYNDERQSALTKRMNQDQYIHRVPKKDPTLHEPMKHYQNREIEDDDSSILVPLNKSAKIDDEMRILYFGKAASGSKKRKNKHICSR